MPPRNPDEADLSYLLLPRGAVAAIGPEKSGGVRNDIELFRSPHGSYRYVLYEKRTPVAAMQVVRRDDGSGVIANVYTRPDRRRRGYATRLLHLASSDFTILEHSKHMTSSGTAWKRRVTRTERSVRDRRAPNAKDTWYLEREDQLTGFRLWRAHLPGLWPQGDDVTVAGVPATKYPDGRITKARWDVFVGDNEVMIGMPFSSPDEAKRFAEAGPRQSVEPRPSVSSDDLEIVNRHRQSIGMRPIDLAAGWTPAEIADMARSIRETGRMANPAILHLIEIP